MFALLLIAVFLLALGSIVYLRLIKQPPTGDASHALPPPPHAGLFTDTNAARAQDERAAKYHPRLEPLAADLRARAAQGDRNVLTFAHETGEPKLYDELLTTLVGRARTSPEELRSLAAYVTQHRQLRGNTALAECVLDDLVRMPDRASARHALYVA
ncbi:MAG TPA: hypothetical protein VER08_09405, partial [Pyrinomonadaceae bacterium]|nr:hypothetical protein [Pyrinomonadaceae bacterium]